MAEFDYSIKAIPTIYNGVRYRSRLEAKWAAFFDLLGWPFTYEPLDLGGWSPDFLLGNKRLFVEVKPIQEFHDATAYKMASSFERASVDLTCLLLVGVSPCISPGHSPEHECTEWQDSGSTIGWTTLLSPGAHAEFWESAYCALSSENRWGLFHQSYWKDLIFGDEDQMPDKLPPWGWRRQLGQIRSLWSNAGNAVQWRGREG